MQVGPAVEVVADNLFVDIMLGRSLSPLLVFFETVYSYFGYLYVLTTSTGTDVYLLFLSHKELQESLVAVFPTAPGAMQKCILYLVPFGPEGFSV